MEVIFFIIKSDAGLYLEVLHLYNRLISSGQHITMTLSLCGRSFLRIPSAFDFSVTTSNQKLFYSLVCLSKHIHSFLEHKMRHFE